MEVTYRRAVGRQRHGLLPAPRLWVALIALLMAGSGLAATGDTPRVELGDDLRIEPITAGVYRHVSIRDVPEYGPIPANGLIVVGDDSAALIDTPWTDDQTARLFDYVEAEFGFKILHVVPTHSHGDCAGGLAEAHRRGARSHALKRTAEFAEKAGDPVPQRTFAERERLSLGGIDVELRYFGGGHTRDNIVAWIPQRDLLFGGCLVKRSGGSAGYIDEADLASWPETVRKVIAAFPGARIVVPGHGKPGAVEYLNYTIQLVEQLER